MSKEIKTYKLSSEGKFVPTTPEDLQPEIQNIIVNTNSEFDSIVAKYTLDGWTLVAKTEQGAKFKNEFPYLMNETVYMKQMRLPDFVEVQFKNRG